MSILMFILPLVAVVLLSLPLVKMFTSKVSKESAKWRLLTHVGGFLDVYKRQDIYNGAKKAISTIYNGAKTVTKAIVNTVKKAADFVNKKIIQQAVKVVKNVVNSIISRSSNTIRKVADKVAVSYTHL